MATPAQLLGQLAQQFAAAGNPQLAGVFRSMSGGGVPPTVTSTGLGSVGARPPVGQLPGQLTSPLIGGQPSSMFRPPLLLGPGSGAVQTGGQRIRGQQVLGGQLGPFGQGPRQSMGSPHLNPAEASIRQNAAMRGLASQLSGPSTAGAGGVPPRVPPTPGAADPTGFARRGLIAPTTGGVRSGPRKPQPRAPHRGYGRPGAALGGAAQKMSAGPKVAAGADWLSANMGLKNWSKSLRNPVKVFKFTRDKFAAGVKTGMLSKGFLGRMAASGTGSTLLGAGATVAAPFNVAWIGDMFGVNDKFQQGSKPDLAAEGVLFGASMGAFGGGPGAAIGAAVGGTLNVLTNGALVESAQQIPWLGGFFGANKGEIDMREIALNMYTAAAEAQGDPELAELAASILEPYLKMIEAEKLPAGSEMEYILMAARQAGFTGFPWAPEEILPAYSADDLAQITGAVSEELQPMFDLANGLVKQDFAHIQDDEMRSKLIESAQDSAANLMESVGVAMMGPASAGILTEAQRRQSSTDLSSQLAADDEFAMMFANAAGM